MTITDFRYVEDLWLRRKRKGSGRLFYVGLPYRVAFRLDGEYQSLTVPEDFATDLASIPSIVPKWIAQKVDSHLEAAVVHDFLCETKMWNYMTAADIFLAAMIVAKTAKWRRSLMYRAVVYLGPRW